MLPHQPEPGNDPLVDSVAIGLPHCRGAVAAAVAADLRTLFAALPALPRLQVVKSSTVRTVAHGSTGGIDIHLKLFRVSTLTDRARFAITGGRGCREARNLTTARTLGLPAVEPLAYGSVAGDRGQQSFVVTRSVPHAQPFSFELPAAALHRVGTLLRQVHDHGLLPGDLHPGNLVLDGTGAPWLLDLSSIRRAGDPDPRRRAAGLAFFCQELDGGPLDHRAGPLLAGYCEPPLSCDLVPWLGAAARSVRQRALVAFGRRSSRACRHTAVPDRRRGEARWYFPLFLPVAEREPLQARCREFLAAPPPPHKHGRRGAVWLGDELVVKQREQGAARRLLRAMYWLRFAGAPVPVPVALATCGGTGHVFVQRLHAPSLAVELGSGRLAGPELRRIARSLGDTVGRLHAHGLRNRDLKLENLVRDPATGAVCMVDLDGVRRRSPAAHRGQGADLGRLLAAFRAAGGPGGTTAVAAFARAYLRARQRLLQPAAGRRIWLAAARRAHEWAGAHCTGTASATTTPVQRPAGP